MRLCLDTKDFVRAHIMAKKIQIKIFKDVELEDLKTRYYTLIVRYHTHTHNWMEIFRAYQAMFDSPTLQSDQATADRCLKLQVLFLVLSPFDNEQSEQMHSLARLKSKLEKLPMYKQLLQLFITKEIFHFADCKPGLLAELAAFGDIDVAEQELMLETMHTRVTQHNIQAVAGYYARVSMTRLANLLGLPQDAMEKELCAMVSKKQARKSGRPRLDQRGIAVGAVQLRFKQCSSKPIKCAPPPSGVRAH